ncbi:hypothetical protein AMTR_s02173p00006690 [Amborella trichopoda]|uniref:Uncharacterized protein n=1 Tax=Amborella trichopoda TaxID=13333 RepID=U5CX61_AMBTC|nr:hypothetical protein AMTR_s02173p00006690 [Amborella trichopoda]
MLRPIQPVHQLASCPTPQSSLSLAIYSTPRPTSSPLIPPQPLFPLAIIFSTFPRLKVPSPLCYRTISVKSILLPHPHIFPSPLITPLPPIPRNLVHRSLWTLALWTQSPRQSSRDPFSDGLPVQQPS